MWRFGWQHVSSAGYPIPTSLASAARISLQGVKRTLSILLIVVLTMVLIAVVVSSLRQKDIPVSFSQVEIQDTNSPVIFGPALKVTFYATNSGKRLIELDVRAVETNGGTSWVADTHTQPTNALAYLGIVRAREAVQVSFVLPREPVRTRLRIDVSPEATMLQKTQSAFRRWWANLRGKEHYKQFWFGNLVIPTYEVVTPEFQ